MRCPSARQMFQERTPRFAAVVAVTSALLLVGAVSATPAHADFGITSFDGQLSDQNHQVHHTERCEHDCLLSFGCSSLHPESKITP